jgi:hypothetical protein
MPQDHLPRLLRLFVPLLSSLHSKSLVRKAKAEVKAKTKARQNLLLNRLQAQHHVDVAGSGLAVMIWRLMI